MLLQVPFRLVQTKQVEDAALLLRRPLSVILHDDDKRREQEPQEAAHDRAADAGYRKHEAERPSEGGEQDYF